MIPVMFMTQTIPSAWFELIWGLMKMDAGHSVYEIDKGSYVGQKRLEYEYVTVCIDYPAARPLIPDIPPGLGIPAPVESMEYVENYFANYLMNPELEPNETYKYATWLVPGVERVIEQLKGAPGNNQACISIGGIGLTRQEEVNSDGRDVIEVLGPEFIDTDNFIDPATGQRDPACLRLVDFRLDQLNTLHMFTYWRSWDLWGGFPANLAGLQLLKEYVGEQIGANDGKIIASSKGLHLYDFVIQVAAKRLGLKDVGTMDDLLQFISKEIKP
jgi:thymidylate synthase